MPQYAIEMNQAIPPPADPFIIILISLGLILALLSIPLCLYGIVRILYPEKDNAEVE